MIVGDVKFSIMTISALSVDSLVLYIYGPLTILSDFSTSAPSVKATGFAVMLTFLFALYFVLDNLDGAVREIIRLRERLGRDEVSEAGQG